MVSRYTTKQKNIIRKYFLSGQKVYLKFLEPYKGWSLTEVKDIEILELAFKRDNIITKGGV